MENQCAFNINLPLQRMSTSRLLCLRASKRHFSIFSIFSSISLNSGEPDILRRFFQLLLTATFVILLVSLSPRNNARMNDSGISGFNPLITSDGLNS